MKNLYGIDIWSDNNFIIKDGSVSINYKGEPSLLEITEKVRAKGHTGPLLLRCSTPHQEADRYFIRGVF